MRISAKRQQRGGRRWRTEFARQVTGDVRKEKRNSRNETDPNNRNTPQRKGQTAAREGVTWAADGCRERRARTTGVKATEEEPRETERLDSRGEEDVAAVALQDGSALANRVQGQCFDVGPNREGAAG